MSGTGGATLDDGGTIPSPVILVGGGRMGEAIVSGLLAAGTLGPDDLVVVEPRDTRRDELSSRHGVSTAPTLSEIGDRMPTVVLAVKPQAMSDVLEQVGAALVQRKASPLVISIAAGVSTARIESGLPRSARVVRVMPNTPAQVHEGMSVISGGAAATDDDVAAVIRLFSALGDVVVVEERHQDACTAVSGSGPAYVAILVDALARAGVSQGLSREVAQRLALQTVGGTAELLRESGMHPEELVDAVSSPGGTTIAAVAELERLGFRAAVGAAVAAAVRRAGELGG